MIKCNSVIEQDQVNILNEMKHDPSSLDYTPYQALIEIDWDAMRFVPEHQDEDSADPQEGTGPIEMTP